MENENTELSETDIVDDSSTEPHPMHGLQKMSHDIRSYIPKITSLDGTRVVTIACLVLSLIIAISMFVEPATPVPKSFSIPLSIMNESSIGESGIEKLGQKTSSVPLREMTSYSGGSVFSKDGCDIPQYILNDSGVSQLHEIVHEEKSFADGPVFFKSFESDIQKNFPNSHIQNFEECWYGTLSTTNDFTLFALVRLVWDHTPDPVVYFQQIVTPTGIMTHKFGSILEGEDFAGISADDHRFYCQGFLGAGLYFLLFSNHPSCEPLDNLLRAV